jgi:hypothetical protein
MPPFEYDTEPLDEREDVAGVFYGGRRQVGQQLVVTNRRLLLGPIDTGIAVQIDTYLLDKAAGGSGSLLKSVLGEYAPMKPKTIWLRHVVSVRATHDCGWFKAAGAEIVTATDETIGLGIVVSPGTPNKDPRNNEARDRFVAVLTAAVQAAKEAPAQPV